MTDHLVGSAEVAKMLGVSRQRVNQLADSYADFPRPQALLAAGRIWSRNSVETWIAAHPERHPRTREEEDFSVDELNSAARRVLIKADQEARKLLHAYKGTEHLLLGIVSDRGGEASKALRASGVTVGGARREVQELIGRGNNFVDWPELPFSPRAKKVLIGAARRLSVIGQASAGPEHLLLSILEARDSVACQALAAIGVDLNELELRIRELVGLPVRLSPPVTDSADARLQRIESVLAIVADAMDSVVRSVREIESAIKPEPRSKAKSAKAKGR